MGGSEGGWEGGSEGGREEVREGGREQNSSDSRVIPLLITSCILQQDEMMRVLR